MTERDSNSSDSAASTGPVTQTRIAAKSGRRSRSPSSNVDSASVTEAVSIDAATRVAGTPDLQQDRGLPLPAQGASNPSRSTRMPGSGTTDTKLTGNQSVVVNVGSTLKDRFVLEQVIARGGMGVVYKARDLRKEEYKDRDPYVAVKVLGEQCKEHPDFFMALQRETRKAQKLAHPNIVTVYDFDCDGDTVFMTMEYLEGQTLDELIRNNQPGEVTLKTAFSIIEAMGQGLAYAHENGIVHCDFKPGNVFLTRHGSVKILDFGISRAIKQPDITSQNNTIFDAGKFGALTPSYASCEMIEGDDPDPRDDIYALACVAYELLTGRHPVNREKATAARNKQMKPVRVKGLNKRQWKGLTNGLAFERTNRTPSVNQFLDDIDGGYRVLGLARGWQMVIGLAFILALSGALLLPYMPPIEFRNGNDNEPANNLKASVPTQLSAEQRDKINRLLEVADVHFMVGRITEPPGTNAYHAYKQVLEIDPRNPYAIRGIVNIANHYETLAREKLGAGDLENTRSLIKAGLEVQPGHQGLTELDDETNPDKSWFKKAMGLVADLF